MSKERQRARAAREAQQAAERQRTAKAAARTQRLKRLKRLKPELPELPKRQSVYRLRRFPPLPWQLKLVLALGWVTVAALVLYLPMSWTARLGLLVIASFALPLIVVLVRDPSRRTR